MMSKSKSLSQHNFKECPVWKWDEEQEGYEPVSNWQEAIKNEPTLFIKATFETHDGTEFDGYLVGGDAFYAFGIFLEDDDYVINLNLPGLMSNTVERIRSKLCSKELELFPLKYKASVLLDGEVVGGQFDISND